MIIRGPADLPIQFYKLPESDYDQLTPLIRKKLELSTFIMKRSDANEFVKRIMPKYESKLANAPLGKSFLECYDPVKLKPSREWNEIYSSVRKEVTDWGIPI